MGRRQGPSEERRAAILAAADAEFSVRGYAGAAIRAIAQRAGVSSALLYWFFPSKAELFAAVLTRRADEQQVFVFPPGVEDQRPDEFLPNLAQGFFYMVSQGQQLGLLKMLLRESDQATEVITIMRGLITTRALGPLEHYFTRQIELGHIRPAPRRISPRPSSACSWAWSCAARFCESRSAAPGTWPTTWTRRCGYSCTGSCWSRARPPSPSKIHNPKSQIPTPQRSRR
jgi:AcrR family transcriptional regulator